MVEPFARIKIHRGGMIVYLMVNGREEFVTPDATRATEFQSLSSAAAYIARRGIEHAEIEEIL